MIPVEYLWIALILVFGFVGASRGLNRELGVTTILLLSLFVLKFAWNQIGEKIVGTLGGSLEENVVKALYYVIVIAFVAFISYEGFSISFPVREQRGVLKGGFGFLGGLLNGYLIIGTIWNALALTDYAGIEVPLECAGGICADPLVPIAACLTEIHQMLVPYLPITFINQYVLLALGMILLLAIVLD